MAEIFLPSHRWRSALLCRVIFQSAEKEQRTLWSWVSVEAVWPLDCWEFCRSGPGPSDGTAEPCGRCSLSYSLLLLLGWMLWATFTSTCGLRKTGALGTWVFLAMNCDWKAVFFQFLNACFLISGHEHCINCFPLLVSPSVHRTVFQPRTPETPQDSDTCEKHKRSDKFSALSLAPGCNSCLQVMWLLCQRVRHSFWGTEELLQLCCSQLFSQSGMCSCKGPGLAMVWLSFSCKFFLCLQSCWISGAHVWNTKQETCWHGGFIRTEYCATIQYMENSLWR